MSTRFDPLAYSTDPAYLGQLECWLTITPLTDPPSLDLADYDEPEMPGYRRATGLRGSFLRPDTVATDGGVVDSKRIHWVGRPLPPVNVTAVLVVARFPGEAPQLVQVLEQPWTFSATGPGMLFQFSFCPSLEVF